MSSDASPPQKKIKMSSNASPLSASPDFNPERCLLPDVMMFEIFQRLPVKSLLRFRCVSRSLCDMIDSQGFIKEHAHHSLKIKSDFQLMIMHHNRKPRHVDFGSENSAGVRVLKHPFNSNRPVIVGCCNGIICLRHDSRMPRIYILWNPSTRKYKKIGSLPCCYLIGKQQSMSGFGYDHAKDDYKIVRIITTESPNEVQVYSLKSNSWKKLDIQLPVGYYEGIYNMKAFVQGAVHWVWKSPLGTISEEKIAAFHLGSETFSLLPLPPCRNTSDPTLIDLEDKLCIIGESYTVTESLTNLTTRIWVMEEYGNKDSWKTYDMDIRYPITRPNSNRHLAGMCTIPFFPVSRGKVIANVEQQSNWILIDIKELKDVTSRNLLVMTSNLRYEGYTLTLCYNSLVQL